MSNQNMWKRRLGSTGHQASHTQAPCGRWDKASKVLSPDPLPTPPMPMGSLLKDLRHHPSSQLLTCMPSHCLYRSSTSLRCPLGGLPSHNQEKPRSTRPEQPCSLAAPRRPGPRHTWVASCMLLRSCSVSRWHCCRTNSTSWSREATSSFSAPFRAVNSRSRSRSCSSTRCLPSKTSSRSSRVSTRSCGKEG